MPVDDGALRGNHQDLVLFCRHAFDDSVVPSPSRGHFLPDLREDRILELAFSCLGTFQMLNE